MKQKIVGTDVDDTVAELVSRWLSLYNLDNNDNLRESDIKNWDIGSYTKIGKRMYDYLTNPFLYDQVLPVVGATWGIRKLKEMGFRVIFITSSTPEQSGKKFQWLLNYGLITDIRDYFEAKDKSLIKCDWIIDDNPENVINAYGQGIVFTREWNKELTGYPRVNDWADIVNYFLNIRNGG